MGRGLVARRGEVGALTVTPLRTRLAAAPPHLAEPVIPQYLADLAPGKNPKPPHWRLQNG